MKNLIVLLFLLVHSTLFAAKPTSYYYSDGMYFSSAFEACSSWVAKYKVWTFVRIDKGPGNNHYCIGIRSDDNLKKPMLFNIVSEMQLCDNKGQKPINGQCPEKCPDGSIKQPGKECPKKCPAKDSIGPQYPNETPDGYRCEGACIDEVSRAVVDSGFWKSIKRPF